MQPEYNQHWPINNNGQAPDAYFYAFFEDSLNQFISTNSSIREPVTDNNTEQKKDSLQYNV